MNLTQKETELLKDLKGQEKLCVDKYTRHSAAASDTQLKDMREAHPLGCASLAYIRKQF